MFLQNNILNQNKKLCFSKKIDYLPEMGDQDFARR